MRVIGLAGWSGAGKTTLLTRLIPELGRRGVSVSTLKHAHHAFDLDTPGKDSYAHRQAGAREVLISSERRWALMRELRGEPEAKLGELLGRLSPVDLVIIEGFKRDPHAKIEIYRLANGKPPLHPEDSSILAVVSDSAFPEAGRPVVDLDDIAAVADIALAAAEPLAAVLARRHGQGRHGEE
ncbi:molybdopterin-guanine dinucleotide biosynthesis protein B [Bosea sp. BE125]|uniref:molybdopterin-guanine dinucleotide biosynthesis protein B n=1 Tax=Bosea sp. BE125 TaxID=2817909 RepID=UPI0028555C3E|nr:molybdopterin-guanine dinucleotide biosynthesis protein B [Bosea sp. BE125]MDR6871199.1 molybdopterin-guanine dinucleotide biosynthesis protein B [Bosea sp. BE125]